jgi:hypothetical protein
MRRRRRVQRVLPELPSRRDLRRLTRAMTPRSRFERVAKGLSALVGLGTAVVLVHRARQQYRATYPGRTT